MRALLTTLSCALLLWMLGPGLALAQTGEVAGQITDDQTGETLPGANVILTELARGAATNQNGEYRITDVSVGEYTLRVTFVGYQTVERAIEVRDDETVTVDVSLRPDFASLDEVVVTGVGEATSKKRLGINVESVSEEKLKTAPALTIESALAGKIAGGTITQVSGQPGVASSIQLRGINTLGDTTPLILVDGVEVNTDNNFAGTTSGGSNLNYNSRLADLDLSDVERIEVTKGAAASTIYGAQGANGVIQIFTKSGSPGAPKLTFSTELSSNSPIGSIDKAQNHFYETDPDGSIAGLERNEETGQWTPPVTNITANTINNNPFTEQTYDAVDTVLRDALTQRYNASLSGGSDLFTYYAAVGILDQEGVQRNTFQKRNSYRANFSIRPAKNLKIDLRSNFIESDNAGTENGDNVSAPLSSALFTQQWINLAARDGQGNIVATTIENDNSTNPLFEWNVRRKDIENIRFITNGTVNYQPLEWLELDYKLGIDRYDYVYDEVQFNFEDNEIAGLSTPEGFVWRVNDASTNLTSTLTSFVRANLTDRIRSSTQVAFDVRREIYNQTESYGQGLPPFRTTTTLDATSDPTVGEYDEEFNTYGLLFNERLEYQEKLGVSFGGRIDYSSAFGEGEESNFFPRGDVFVRPSEFAFWAPLRGTWNELKLRAAYGEAGIQPGPFDRIRTLSQELVGSNGTLVSPPTLQNPRLLVEETQEFEVGADMEFRFGDAWLSPLALSVTYWSRGSNSVIQDIDVAPSRGADDITDNGVDLTSTGFDVSLNSAVLYSENFTWNTTVNFGRQRSTVDNIASGQDIVVRESYLLREGEEVGSFFGFNPVQDLNEQDQEGNLILDVNGDGEVNGDDGNFVLVDGAIVNADSRAVQFRPYKEKLGDASPDFTMGFRNDFTVFQNFGLGFQIDWTQGPDIYNRTRQWLYRDNIHADFDTPVFIDVNGNGQVDELGDLDGDGQIDTENSAFVPYYRAIYNTNQINSFFVEDGTYVRLREAYLSYDFADLVNRASGRQIVEGFQLRVSGRNLLTFTDYKGFDPEVSHYGNDSRIRGFDEFTYPRFRTLTVGATLRF